jgi:hypothetical protein
LGDKNLDYEDNTPGEQDKNPKNVAGGLKAQVRSFANSPKYLLTARPQCDA